MNSDLEVQIHTFHWVTNNFYLCLYEVQEALETVIAVSKSAGFFSLTITYFHFLSRCNYFNSFWDRGIIMSSWSVLKGTWDTLKLVRWQQKRIVLITTYSGQTKFGLFHFFPKHLKQKSSLKERGILPVSSLQVIFKEGCGSSTSTTFTSRLSPMF